MEGLGVVGRLLLEVKLRLMLFLLLLGLLK